MMEKKFKLIAIIIPALVIAAFLTGYFIQQKIMHGKRIKVSGNIEGDDVRLSFRVDGQILELLTDEGNIIHQGDVVARLKTDELSKVVAKDEAALNAAKYEYELSSIDYIRAENLFKVGAISQQKRDEAKTRYDSAKANVDNIQAQLDLAITRLGFTDLLSPLDGFVLVKSSLAGEVLQPGTPVFTAIDLNNIWVTAYINETDLGRVKLNQEAYVITDTYPGKKYRGWVSFISSEAEFTPKFIQTNAERVKLVYRVKIRVDNESLELKPGMPADAYIIE
ncbi:MAG: efflux RND transporter periplasmic adaptor subunit [Candidatus Omnitrophica bacterium]|nr:efflux RND transporter periplasmic adaptor subunit [Candidatus Omnitrophota bacterium]